MNRNLEQERPKAVDIKTREEMMATVVAGYFSSNRGEASLENVSQLADLIRETAKSCVETIPPSRREGAEEHIREEMFRSSSSMYAFLLHGPSPKDMADYQSSYSAFNLAIKSQVRAFERKTNGDQPSSEAA